MANAVYPLFKQSLLAGDANADLDNNTSTDGPYVALVDTGTYTYSSAHQFYSSLSGIVGTDQRITTPTVTTGLFDGDNVTFTAVTGATVDKWRGRFREYGLDGLLDEPRVGAPRISLIVCSREARGSAQPPKS